MEFKDTEMVRLLLPAEEAPRQLFLCKELGLPGLAVMGKMTYTGSNPEVIAANLGASWQGISLVPARWAATEALRNQYLEELKAAFQRDQSRWHLTYDVELRIEPTEF